MVWIIVLVYRADNLTPTEAFKIPIQRLIAGLYRGVATDLDLAGGNEDMVNPFQNGRGRVDTRELQAVQLLPNGSERLQDGEGVTMDGSGKNAYEQVAPPPYAPEV